MSTMEIVLLIIGVVIFIASFLVPDNSKNIISAEISQDEIDRIVESKFEAAQKRLQDRLDGDVQEALERVEVAFDKMANEKMLAFGEYSEELLTAINNNHQETVFLYNMLNDKAVDIKNIVREIDQKKKEMDDSAFKALTAVVNTDSPVVLENVVGEYVEDASFDDSDDEMGNRNLAIELNQFAKRNKNESILELHRQNKSIIEIARELGLGMGEVKLVIDLFEENKGQG